MSQHPGWARYGLGRLQTPQRDQRASSASRSSPHRRKPSDPPCAFLRHFQAFYLTSMGGAVFLLPYISIFLRDLGATDSQIGMLCALRPWLAITSTFVGPVLADRHRVHRGQYKGPHQAPALLNTHTQESLAISAAMSVCRGAHPSVLAVYTAALGHVAREG